MVLKVYSTVPLSVKLELLPGSWIVPELFTDAAVRLKPAISRMPEFVRPFTLRSATAVPPLSRTRLL